MFPLLLITLAVLSCSLLPTIEAGWLFGNSDNNEFPTEYGVDVSFPIHHPIDRSRYAYQADRYKKVMQGCYDKYSFRECDSYEQDRLQMNLDQPHTQHNYTELGFKKLRLPDEIYKAIRTFYDANKDKEKLENWPRGNTYVNHWDSPSYMVSLEDRSLRGAAPSLKNQIWEGVRPILEEWTGHKLEPTSLYGIRVYKDGSVLAPHVDRLPLVTSCIIQVDQDLNEPWPVEVYDHNGNAHNVTMQPGDMVLYESHTVIHGRPFPMNGTRYANVFVHFQPVDHQAMNNEDHEIFEGRKSIFATADHNERNIGGHEQSNHREDAFRRRLQRPRPVPRDPQQPPPPPPPPGSNADRDGILARQGMSKHVKRTPTLLDDKQLKIRTTILRGDVQELERLLELTQSDPDTVTNTATDSGSNGKEGETVKEGTNAIERAKAMSKGLHSTKKVYDLKILEEEDENQWRVFHETVRVGNIPMMELLIKHGIDVNAKIKNGHNAIWIAKEMLPKGSEQQRDVIKYLEKVGVKDIVEVLPPAAPPSGNTAKANSESVVTTTTESAIAK